MGFLTSIGLAIRIWSGRQLTATIEIAIGAEVQHHREVRLLVMALVRCRARVPGIDRAAKAAHPKIAGCLQDERRVLAAQDRVQAFPHREVQEARGVLATARTGV